MPPPPYPLSWGRFHDHLGIARSPEHYFLFSQNKMHPNFSELFLVFEERVVRQIFQQEACPEESLGLKFCGYS
jgi:hypothetical protein